MDESGFGTSKVIENIIRKMCYSRAFELEIVKAHKQKLIDAPVYLSIGQEAAPAALSEVLKGYYVFGQHRSHSIYLSFGGSPKKLVDELLGLGSGCVHGNGGSACIQDLDAKVIGYDGFIGENVPIAVGFSLATNNKTVCFFGDGSAEEDYVASSFGFAATHDLPVLFVCMDNNLSILTEKKVRRSWDIAKVANAYGLYAIDLDDDPIYIGQVTNNIRLPSLINVHTCRHYWHEGSGQDNKPECDSLDIVKIYVKYFDVIAREETEKAQKLWRERLEKLSER